MITVKDVEHVANLARLELDEDEKFRLVKQMGDILNYVEQMNEVDTTGVEPMSHAIVITNVMRDDVVVSKISKEELMKNAPEKEDGFFKVPKIG